MANVFMPSSAWFQEVVSGRTTGLRASSTRALLAALEPVYRAVVRSKNARFDNGRSQQTDVDAPVVSVGNLTVGGTGKTPFVCWLAEWFQAHGAPVTLISRGYRAKPGQPNDEALELAARLPTVPHIQNPDRIAAAKEALEANPRQVLLLDDAFQHRRIARDLDIVLLDALQPFGYDHLLPRGLLREPVEGLARAHIVALSRSDAVDEAARAAIRRRVEAIAPRAVWLELAHRPTSFVNARAAAQRLDLEALRGRRVAVFCGIGNPEGFRHTLTGLDLEMVDFRTFADHYSYPAESLTQMESWIRSLGSLDAVVCTQKDLVKIPRDTIAGLPLWAVEIRLEITVGQELLEACLEPLAARVP